MFLLTEKSTIGHQFLMELRDTEIQQDPLRFRKNIERLGQIFAYEISKQLNYSSVDIPTGLGTKKSLALAQNPVLVAILRAGLPLHHGVLSFFDRAENAFIGAYRGKHDAKEHFEIEMDYIASANIQGKPLIICDPMLATGKSVEKAYHALLRFGIPSKTFVVSVLASSRGVRYVKARMPECRLYVGDIDEELNNKSYIVPGLGDAGDLAFGEKI